jgi:hypothetical protein
MHQSLIFYIAVYKCSQASLTTATQHILSITRDIVSFTCDVYTMLGDTLFPLYVMTIIGFMAHLPSDMSSGSNPELECDGGVAI